jgi:tryptophan halogenase
VGFHNYWAKQRQTGDQTPLVDYSLGASLGERRQVHRAVADAAVVLSVFDWALHLDASLFAPHLRRYAEAAGVTAHRRPHHRVKLRPEDGFIRAGTIWTTGARSRAICSSTAPASAAC